MQAVFHRACTGMAAYPGGEEGKAMKKPGRPAVPAKRKRSVIIPVRFTPKEAREIAQSAKIANCTVSEWLRDLIKGWA